MAAGESPRRFFVRGSHRRACNLLGSPREPAEVPALRFPTGLDSVRSTEGAGGEADRGYVEPMIGTKFDDRWFAGEN
jgi:hypothetical protein